MATIADILREMKDWDCRRHLCETAHDEIVAHVDRVACADRIEAAPEFDFGN